MPRLRNHWFAVFGALVILSLSLATAFGAKPTDEAPNRGQQVSAFVHDLVFGEQDEESDEEEVSEEEEKSDEDSEEGSEEGTDEDTEESDEELGDDANSHGKCVADVAKSDEVGPPNDNHGGAVNTAARETCWESPDAGAASAGGPGKSAAAHQRKLDRAGGS